MRSQESSQQRCPERCTERCPERWLVTGGAGFIGSCFVLMAVQDGAANVLNLDKLTYSGNLGNLSTVSGSPFYAFRQGDIGATELIGRILREFAPTGIVNFAAESHVDRSITDPEAFVRSNVLGLCTLLRCTTEWWKGLPQQDREHFRFLHISTDEVFGSLGFTDQAFTESTAYAPNSPYSASKAAADHFVRAFHETYGLPVLITNCSNNYGPRQFPEKLIPLTILNALQGEALPVYGKGENIRDWLHVEDHCEAVRLVLQKGRVGESYAVGGRAEVNNLDMVKRLCSVLDELRPKVAGRYADQITFVSDRPGHDLRYAIDCSKIERELGWQARHTLQSGLQETVRWYLDNPEWVRQVQSGVYRQWLEKNYKQRA